MDLNVGFSTTVSVGVTFFNFLSMDTQKVVASRDSSASPRNFMQLKKTEINRLLDLIKTQNLCEKFENTPVLFASFF